MFLQAGGLAAVPYIGAEIGYYSLFVSISIITMSLQHKL
jgi:hypothetical protein